MVPIATIQSRKIKADTKKRFLRQKYFPENQAIHVMITAKTISKVLIKKSTHFLNFRLNRYDIYSIL